MKIENYAFEGEGMQRVFENEKWTVGIKNWKPANDITGSTAWNDTTKQMNCSFLWKAPAH